MSLSEDLQKFVGSKAGEYLRRVATNKWSGAFFGAITTAVIQSSSATTVITAGMVDAGLLTFQQSLGITVGAHIGTTITAQFVAFKLTELAPLLIAIGFILAYFSKGRKRYIGNAMLSLGILFLGLNLMGGAIAPLKSDPFFMSQMAALDNPFIGLLAATLFTAVIQSSSVTTSLVVLMGAQGLISLPAAIPLIFGANIGTTVTVLFASIKLGRESKRMAAFHLLFSVFGVILLFPFIPQFAGLVSLFGGAIGNEIANAHTLFNVITGLVVLVFLSQFASFVTRLVPLKGEKTEEYRAVHLERAGSNPMLVLDLAQKELARQGGIALRMLESAHASVVAADDDKMRSVYRNENLVDHLQKEITTALKNTAMRNLSEYDAQRITAYMRITNDLERVGDLAAGFGLVTEHMQAEGCKFSKKAVSDINSLQKLSAESLNLACQLIMEYNERTAREIIAIEEQVDKMMPVLHGGHTTRMKKGQCSVAAGQVFHDVIYTYEKVSDLSKSIAVQLVELNAVREKTRVI